MIQIILVTIALAITGAFCLKSDSVDFRHIETYIFFMAVFCFSAATGINIEYLFGLSERDLPIGMLTFGILGGGLVSAVFIIRHAPVKKSRNNRL